MSCSSPSASSDDLSSAGGRKRSRSVSLPGSEVESDLHETDHERAKRKRKEQRMKRNRASAARSRKRKEDALTALSNENEKLREELELLKSQLAAATSSRGVAAVNHSNFIVLMKLAAIFLIHIATFVATFLVELTPPSVLAPVFLPWTPVCPFLTTFDRPRPSFAAAAMPFSIPPVPVR